MPKMLDYLHRVLRGEVPPPPIATLIGFELTSIEPGLATVEFEATKRHANPMGTLHGGVLRDIADAAMGMAFGSTLEEGETFTTLELKINFLKPVQNTTLQAIGRVIKAGRTIGLVECDVTDEQNQLVARATSVVSHKSHYSDCHSGLDPESSLSVLDSRFRGNDGFGNDVKKRQGHYTSTCMTLRELRRRVGRRSAERRRMERTIC